MNVAADSNYRSICVVGCGIAGLTTAVTLQRQLRLPVRIIARELPPHTTSNIAAAVWLPFQVDCGARTLRWAAATRQVLASQMADPATGVFEVELFDLQAETTNEPEWVCAVDSFRTAGPGELPTGYSSAIVARVPMIDTPVYMGWLIDQFRQHGGTIEQQTVRNLADVARPQTLVVNCAGLGARELCGDGSLFPIRGQIARLAASGLTRAYTVEQGPDAIAYLLPRRHELIAGGTADRGDWSTVVDPATADQILEKAGRLDPRLKGVAVIEHVVGLRPGRPVVRVEGEPTPGGGLVIHNYGHGGSGLTLCWGCAEEVARIALDTRPRDAGPGTGSQASSGHR
jgi:D-amino-acid oxidase